MLPVMTAMSFGWDDLTPVKVTVFDSCMYEWPTDMLLYLCCLAVCLLFNDIFTAMALYGCSYLICLLPVNCSVERRVRLTQPHPLCAQVFQQTSYCTRAWRHGNVAVSSNTTVDLAFAYAHCHVLLEICAPGVCKKIEVSTVTPYFWGLRLHFKKIPYATRLSP